MTDTAIRTSGLTRDFNTVRAVDNLTLEVPSGVIFGFLGPNASGKTTTINLLLGLLEPTSGTAEVLGRDVISRSDDIRSNTGALLEHSGLYEQMSAEDNLEYYGRIWHLPAAERRSRIKELLEHIGLWDRRSEKINKWSRGMKQKLAVARALIHRPPLIFLDEPTAGLDVVSAASLREDLANLAEREGVTVFLTTHNMSEAEKLCGRVAVIRHGSLIAVGSPDELRTRAVNPHVEIRGSGFDENLLEELRARPEVREVESGDGHLTVYLQQSTGVAPLVSLLVNCGASVEEVIKSKATLEEVFLTLVTEEE